MKHVFLLSIEGSFDLGSGAADGWISDTETAILYSFHSVAELLDRLKFLSNRQSRPESDGGRDEMQLQGITRLS